MKPVTIRRSVDPSKVPPAPRREVTVPVIPNPIKLAPMPKHAPAHAGVSAPKTKPCYGMTRPILSAPSHIPLEFMG